MEAADEDLKDVICIRVTEKEKSIIKDMAARNETDVAELVRELIFRSGLVVIG